MASLSHHPPLSRTGRGRASKQHPSAIAAFSVEAYSTLEAESHAHLAAVAAAASRRRRDDEECDEGNGGDEEETAAAATEVREKRERISCRTFHSHSIGASGLSTSFVEKKTRYSKKQTRRHARRPVAVLSEAAASPSPRLTADWLRARFGASSVAAASLSSSSPSPSCLASALLPLPEEQEGEDEDGGEDDFIPSSSRPSSSLLSRMEAEAAAVRCQICAAAAASAAASNGSSRRQHQSFFSPSSSSFVAPPFCRRYSEQSPLTLKEDEVAAVLEAATGEKRTSSPPREEGEGEEDENGCRSENASGSASASRTAPILAKLIVDAWLRSGHGPARHLAFAALSQCGEAAAAAEEAPPSPSPSAEGDEEERASSSSSCCSRRLPPPGRARAFDLVLSLALHADLLDDDRPPPFHAEDEEEEEESDDGDGEQEAAAAALAQHRRRQHSRTASFFSSSLSPSLVAIGDGGSWLGSVSGGGGGTVCGPRPLLLLEQQRRLQLLPPTPEQAPPTPVPLPAPLSAAAAFRRWLRSLLFALISELAESNAPLHFFSDAAGKKRVDARAWAAAAGALLALCGDGRGGVRAAAVLPVSPSSSSSRRRRSGGASSLSPTAAFALVDAASALRWPQHVRLHLVRLAVATLYGPPRGGSSSSPREDLDGDDGENDDAGQKPLSSSLPLLSFDRKALEQVGGTPRLVAALLLSASPEEERNLAAPLLDSLLRLRSSSARSSRAARGQPWPSSPAAAGERERALASPLASRRWSRG